MEDAARGIQNPCEQRQVLPRLHVLREVTLQPGHQLQWVAALVLKNLQAGHDGGHQQGRSHPLAADIAEHKPDPAVVEGAHVEEIAPDFVARSLMREDLESFDAGDRAREEIALDAGGDRDLVPDPLRLALGFLQPAVGNLHRDHVGEQREEAKVFS